MRVLTVGELANAVGVTARTIRFWEAKGLLAAAARTGSGYRVFTDTDLARARFIHQAQALGLTLAQIRNVIDQLRTGTSPCDCVRQAIDQQIAAIDREMADLIQLRNTLAAARYAARTDRPSDREPIVCDIIERAAVVR